MSDRISQPEDGSSAPSVAAEKPSPPQLRMKPAHFFSNEFRMEVVTDEDERITAGEDAAAGNHNRLDQGWGIVLMIVTIGIPVLGYCVIVAS